MLPMYGSRTPLARMLRFLARGFLSIQHESSHRTSPVTHAYVPYNGPLITHRDLAVESASTQASLHCIFYL
jgi:hypothetical protein